MSRIVFLTKRSVFVVFFISTAINPLMAKMVTPTVIVKKQQKNSRIQQDVSNVLVQKGLEEKVAVSKVKKLFQACEDKLDKLSTLYNYPEIFGSKKSIHETLANYSLHGKSFNPNSFDSLKGLAQKNSIASLNKEQIELLHTLASS